MDGERCTSRRYATRGLAVGAIILTCLTAATVRSQEAGQGTTAPPRPVPLELFKTWNFDKQPTAQPPAGFSPFTIGAGEAALWMVQSDANAPSPPNIVRQSAPCPSEGCTQVLLVDSLIYEYPDVSVHLRLATSPADAAGAAGLVVGARNGTSFYAATVDMAGQVIELLQVDNGTATVLARATVKPKRLPWHVLRVRRNTIISKEFIEVVYDSVQVLSYESKALQPGQIGVLTRGPALVGFDNLNAAPLYSQRPLSPPAAY